MRFLERIFGKSARNEGDVRKPVAARLEIDEFSHGLVSIEALDFIGHSAMSPNDRYRLIWADRHPDGTRGGYREEGHGSWALLENDRIIFEGKLERPQEGHVANNGNFIVSDWMFGSGLYGRFVALRADGTTILKREFTANLGRSAISGDGSFAICHTYNAPGSADSCRYVLFDLGQGKEIADWEQETGWADGYEFDTENHKVILGAKEGDQVAYDFAGQMVDRKGWQARRIFGVPDPRISAFQFDKPPALGPVILSPGVTPGRSAPTRRSTQRLVFGSLWLLGAGRSHQHDSNALRPPISATRCSLTTGPGSIWARVM